MILSFGGGGGGSFNPDLLNKKGTKCGPFTEKNRPTQEVQHLISSFWAGPRRIRDQKLIFYGPLYSGPFSEGRFRGGGGHAPPPPPSVTTPLIEGIEAEIKETPATILKTIQVGISSANLVVPEYEFDRCHRIGKKYTKNGKTYQSVLLRLAFWRTRNFLYQNRKLLPFKIYADLTQRRKSLLNFAKFKIKNGQNLESGEHCEAISRSLDFVFCDLNCRLKVKSKIIVFIRLTRRESSTVLS